MTSRFQILARGRTKTARGQMNKTEARYADELTADDSVLKWWYEPTRFRISHPEKGTMVSAWFTPDFMVLYQDGTVAFDDVKSSGGFNDNAAAVRVKAVAEKYPLFVFRVVTPKRKKDGGGWVVERA